MVIIQKTTPNFSKGRNIFKPELIVIHIMAGTLVGTDDWFSRPVSQVSAHYGVGLTGEIHQYVQEQDTAWHTGRVSNPTFVLYKPNVNPNLYTIGIEHEGNDLLIAPDIQLQTTANLIKDICTRYNIKIDREHIIGHREVFDKKPSCPSGDLRIIDKILSIINPPEPLVTIQVPQSKVQKVLDYIKTLN